MEANTNEDITLEEIEKREKRFESLKKFFESDMQLKQTLLELAPTEKDDFNEESRMQYTDKLYKELRDIEREFLSMINSLGLSPSSADAITKHFDKAREAFLVSRYEPGVIQKLYKTQFSDMSLQLIETVKNRCIGYTGRANLSQLIKSSCSINELLHVMHSYIINNENILQAMPMISINKKEGYYPIRLYGEENEISRKIFDEFPLDESVGWTDIISMQNKILMMIRDKGHALTIDMDISKDEGVFIKYFVPKLCNEGMIRALPGINLNAITENGATGAFAATKEDITQKLFDFIEKVPTDADIEYIPIDWSSIKNTTPQNEKRETIFNSEQAKELAMESGEKGRKINFVIDLKNRLKNAINKLKTKTTGKDNQQVGGNTNDDNTRN